MRELAELCDQLKAGLSDLPTEGTMHVAELTERIPAVFGSPFPIPYREVWLAPSKRDAANPWLSGIPGPVDA